MTTKTEQSPVWTQDELDNFMDVHGIVHVQDAIRALNHSYDAQRNPINYLATFSVIEDNGPEDIE